MFKKLLSSITEKQFHISLFALVLTVIAVIAMVVVKTNSQFTSAIDREMKMELTYNQLDENSAKVDNCDYVQFSAFFARDLNSDGYVERLDGTCKQVSDEDNLYIELNVLTNGYLENGVITINPENNFNWSTSMVADTVIGNNYIGNVSRIELKPRINNGSQKMMWGKITPALKDNINNYSKMNSVTLTGTHVIENDDGTETRTEINITREIKVDWYDVTKTSIDVPTETEYLERLLSGDETVVRFYVSATENERDLLLQKQVMEIEIPQFMTFDATNATCTDSGVTSEYNPETHILTLTREATVDENGKLTKVISSYNKYYIKVTYPRDAYDAITSDTASISFPTKGYYYGYNNDSKINNENVFDNPYVSSAEGTKTVNYVKKDEEADGKIWNVHTTIGERMYDRNYGNYVREITKVLPMELYNGNRVNEDDEYKVTWEVDVGDANSINKITLSEATNDNEQQSEKFNGTTSMYDYSSIKKISFRSVDYALGENGWIKLYNADIADEDEALIKTFNKSDWKKEYTLEDVKTIRIETSAPVNNYCVFYVDLIKVINDEKIVEDYKENEFADLTSIYTYLKGKIDAPEGVVYEGGETTASIEVRDFAHYVEKYSVVDFYMSEQYMSSQKTENINFTIATRADYELEEKWKNSIFVIELPEQIIKAKIQSVESTNSNVAITNYYTYKENGKYLIKIYTENSDGEVFNLKVNADLTANPLLRTATTTIRLYGYNELCDNYYSDNTDLYDVDGDGLNTDDVAVRPTYFTINNIGSSGMNTTEYVTDYDDNPNSVTVAPNIADIEKTDNERTAKINVNLMNNFDGTLSEILVLGRIPFENNSYVINGSSMGSQFTAQLKNKIVVPERLASHTTIYYSENGTATKDLNDASNNWKEESEITDWSTIKSYLIDLGNYKMVQDEEDTFYYVVEVPGGLGYNSASFSHHAVYYCLDTTTGKLATQTEPNKVGIQVVGKFNFKLTKVVKNKRNIVIPGASFSLTTTDANGDIVTQVARTDLHGELIFENVYVEKQYMLKELSVPNDYALLVLPINFVVHTNNDGGLTVQTLQGATFAEDVSVSIGDDGYHVVSGIVEDETKYSIQITKNKRNNEQIKVENAIYKVETTDNQENAITVTGRTDANGVVTLSGLYPNRHCVLTETYVGSDYIVSEDQIGFTGTIDNNGNLVINVDTNSPTFNGEIGYEINEKGVNTAKVKLDDEAKVKLRIKKVNANQESLEGVRFVLSSSKGTSAIITNQNGEAKVSGLYTNVEYTLQEKEADGYYLAENKKFTITRNEAGELIIDSADSEFINAVVNENPTENQNSISVTIENEAIPKYTLNVLKVEENLDEENVENLTRLEGARYKITSLDTNAEYSISTNAQGIGELSNLYQYIEGRNVTGKYTIKEIEAPSGYVLNPEEVTFIVKNNNQNLEVEIENEETSQTYKKAIVNGNTVTIVLQDKPYFKLNKIDSETGLPLANAQFVIYSVDENGKELDFAKDDKGNYIGTLNEYGYYVVTSNSNGVITLPLINGLYKAVEVTYPDGYMEEVTEEFFKISDGKEEDDEESEQVVQKPKLEIYTIEDLETFAQNVKNGNKYSNYEVLLMNDLDFESADSYASGTVNSSLTKAGGETGFVGIGAYGKSFDGIFDGQGHAIYNLYMYREDITGYYYENNVALFENVSGTIKNLTVTGEVSVKKGKSTYGSSVAGIVATISGSNAIVDNCHNKVNVTNDERYGNYSSGAGGVVAIGTGGLLVKNCTNEGTIINKSQSEYSHAAGIVGNGGPSSLTIVNCHNSGVIKCEDRYVDNGYSYTGHVPAQIGGICSFCYGEIINCSNTGDIIVDSPFYVGGIVGNGGVTLEKSFNTGKIRINPNGTSGSIGGLAGTNNGSTYQILDSYNTGDIIVECSSENSALQGNTLGGIVGNGYVNGCYNTGNIKLSYNGTYDLSSYTTNIGQIGGIVGKGNVLNCYNKGNVEYIVDEVNSANRVTLFVGGIGGNEATVQNCYNTGNVKSVESGTVITSYTGTIVGKGKIKSVCAYLDTIQIEGQPVLTGTSVSDVVLKSQEFYNSINEDGRWKYNEENYPTLIQLRETSTNPTTEVNYIEDLVDISDAIQNGYRYNGGTIKLKRTLDFNDARSYRDATSISYGDINKNGVVEPIKTELTTGKGFPTIGKFDRLYLDADFDGKGYEINNLYINGIAEDCYVGLFGYTKKTIKNLNVSGQITIKLSLPEGHYSGLTVGGIVASVNQIQDCNSNVNIKILENSYRTYAGGVAGTAGGVYNCNNSGKIISYGNYIDTSYYGNNTSNIGGVAGQVSLIRKSSNKGSVTSAGGNTGGITGTCSSISECYNLGDVSGNEYVGGIVGKGAAIDCYNTGNIYGNKYVGGIAGSATGEIRNTYNTGYINATEYVGRIMGYSSTSTNVSDAFHLSTSIIDGKHINNNGELVTDERLKSDFVYNALNENSVWQQRPNAYPVLIKAVPENLNNSTEITVNNTLKKFKITTAVYGNIGGTISGDGEDPYETVIYKEDNTKVIVMNPTSGYGITKITINGKLLDFELDNPEDSYTMPASYFHEMTEDKHIVVTYKLLDQILTVKKTNEDGEPLGGAKFNVSRDIKSDYVDDSSKYHIVRDEENALNVENMVANGTYYYAKEDDKFVSNADANETANSYLEIDLTDKTGEYYVTYTQWLKGPGAIAARVVEDTRVYDIEDKTGRITYRSETSYGNEYGQGGQAYLQAGKKYYLHFTHRRDNSSSTSSVRNLKITPVTYDMYPIELQGESLVSTNQGEGSTTSQGYIPIDLTAVNGEVTITVNAEISSEVANDHAYAFMSKYISYYYWHNTNTSFFDMSGDVEAKDYTMKVTGGDQYYLMLGYIKNASIDGGTDTFKINSVTISIDDVTTNSLGIGKIVIAPGTYTVTETQAPEGYTLNATPKTVQLGAGLPNTVTFENARQTGVTVHHYYKNGNGQYTTYRVAEDESYLGDIGSEYSTAPKIDLKGVDIEKDGTGNYVLPTNAVGTYTEEGVVVNYYYESAPIKLRINHYIEGTTTPLATEVVETTNSELHQLANGYEIVANGQYDVSENSDYANIINGRYNLAYITSSVKSEVSLEDEITYTEDATLDYYYSEKQHTITTEAKTHTENRTNKLTGRKEEVEVIGGSIKLEDNSDIETVYHGENSTNRIIVTPDENYNVKTIKLQNIDEDETSTIIVYGEGEDTNTEITYTVNSDRTITLNNFANVIKDKKIIAEFEPVSGTVIVHYYYEGTGEEFGNDPVKVELMDGNPAENVTHTDLVGEPYRAAERLGIAERYMRTSVSGNVTGEYTTEPINVYYYYQVKPFVIENTQITKNCNLTAITSRTTQVPYVISYNATIKDYIGDVEVEITDTLEYKIDAANSNLNGGTYNDTNKTITWIVTIPNIDTYDSENNEYTINITKTISLLYKDVDEMDDSITNNVKGILRIENTTRENEDNASTTISLPGHLIVRYVDKYTDEEIADSTLKDGALGSSFNTDDYKKTIANYTLVEEPDPKTGVYTKGTITKTYYYAMNTSLRVQHIDKLTNQKLVDDEVTNGKENDDYTTSSKTIEHYKVSQADLPTNATGKLTVVRNSNGTYTTETVVKYYYIHDAKVVENHIDIIDNRVLATETHNGYEGDSYNIPSRTIDSYTLVETYNNENKIPANKSGNMTRSDITVNYYYIRPAKVIVQHIDKATNEKIADDETINGVQNQAYTTSSKNVENYVLVETPDNKNGSMTVTVDGDGTVHDTTTVTYIYSHVSAGVIEKHVDIETGAILYNEVHDGNEGDAYKIDPKEYDESDGTTINFKGYELVETDRDSVNRLPDNAEGTMTIEPITVTYYYRRPAKVRVQYIDKLTGETLTDDVIINGYQNDPYTTSSKTFGNYKLDEDVLPTNAEGQMLVTVDDQGNVVDETIVKYYYIHDAKVVEKHIDIKNDKVIDTKDHSGYEGDSYDIDAKEFEGYDLVTELEDGTNKLPTNSEGSMTRETIEVIYYYIKKSAVKVNYYDINSNEKIANEEIINGHEGDQYETEDKDIENYKIVLKDKDGNVKYPTNAMGTMTSEIIEVNYYYNKKTSVTTRYYDIVSGEEIAEQNKKDGLQGDAYTTEEKEIDNYDIVKENYPKNAKGNMGAEPTFVDYYYIRKMKVIVHYKDRDTGEEVSEDIIIDGHEGDVYHTKGLDIEGYELVKVPTDKDGTMGYVTVNGEKRDYKEVTYYYALIIDKPIFPQTGEDSGKHIVLALIGIGFVLMITSKKLYNKNQKKIEAYNKEMLRTSEIEK